MIRNRILSLLVCAALLACLLAGCSTSSGTDGGEAASSSSSAASSESIPSSTTQANIVHSSKNELSPTSQCVYYHVLYHKDVLNDLHKLHPLQLHKEAFV